jgi:hypothetical protein
VVNELVLVIVAVLSVARTARLIVFDKYPPVVWLRLKWDQRVPEGRPWHELLHCAFCATPYLAVGMLAWMWVALPGSDPYDQWSSAWWWLIVNGTWGLSYISAIIVAYDQPE